MMGVVMGVLGSAWPYVVAGALAVVAIIAKLAHTNGVQSQQIAVATEEKKDLQHVSQVDGAVGGMSADVVQRELHKYDRQ